VGQDRQTKQFNPTSRGKLTVNSCFYWEIRITREVTSSRNKEEFRKEDRCG